MSQQQQHDEYDQSSDAIDAEFEVKGKPSPRALVPTYEMPMAVHSDYYVRKPIAVERNLIQVERRLLAEADLAGEDMYYAWGTGDDRVEGGSVILAMSMFRAWGNCVVEALPMQETRDAYIFTARFIDLETGSTIDRQFRQSKKWTVWGKFDAARKEDIRFNIGQSKAARNVILRVLPEFLKNNAIKKAKEGVRLKLEKFVADKGIAAAQDLVIDALVKEGVPVERILEHYQIANKSALDLDNIVELRGQLSAIQKGEERADAIFAPTEAEQAAKAAKSPEALRAAAEHHSAMSEVAASLAGTPSNGNKTAPAPVHVPTPPVPKTQPLPPATSSADKLKSLRAELDQADNILELDDLWKGWFDVPGKLTEAEMQAAESIFREIHNRISQPRQQQQPLPDTQNGSAHAAAAALADASEEAKKYALQFGNSMTLKGVNRIMERAKESTFNELDMMFIRARHVTRLKELEDAKKS